MLVSDSGVMTVITTNQQFSTGGDFASSQGTFVNVWVHSWLSKLGDAGSVLLASSE